MRDARRSIGPMPALDAHWFPVIIESLPEGLIVWDRDGRVLFANERAGELLGLTVAQMSEDEPVDTGWVALDLDGAPLDPDDFPIRQVLRTGRSGNHAHGVRRADGSVVWLNVNVEVLDRPEPGGPGIVATFRDTTELQVGRNVDRALLRMATRLVEHAVGDETTIAAHLADVGSLASAGRVAFFSIEHEHGRVRVTHDWSRDPHASPLPLTEVSLDRLPRLLARLGRREVVMLDPDAADTPFDGVREALQVFGLATALAAPVVVGNQLQAYVVVGWARPGGPDRRVIAGVAVAAELLAARLELERVQQDLRELTVTLDDRVRERSAELQDEKDRIGALVDAIPDLMFEIDAAGRFVDVHAPDESMLVMPAASFVGRPASEVMDLALQGDLVRSVKERLRGGLTEVDVLEYRTDVLDGTMRSFECRVVPRANGGLVAVVRDITGQAERARLLREHSARLSRANEDLERAVRAKDEFLAGVGHELRTPLSAILGLTEILLDDEVTPLTASQHSAVETIRASGSHLLSLINDLLDLDQITNRMATLALDDVDLVDVVRLAIDLVGTTADKGGVRLELDPGQGIPPIRGDRRRLGQVLLNLLENGVKFTPAGGVVGVDLWAPDRATVACTVWDTGIGLDPGDHERIFEPFVQVDSGADRRYVGSGLGLTLAERFVALHGGHIELTSALGQGTRFTVVLPVDGPGAASPEIDLA